MSDFLSLATDEFRWILRRPVTWVLAGALGVIGAVFGSNADPGTVVLFPVGLAELNGAEVIGRFLLLVSILASFGTLVLAGPAVERDLSVGIQSLFMATPVRSRDYLLGRLVGGLTGAVVVQLAAVAGLAIGFGLQPAGRLGPWSLGDIARPGVLFVVSNTVVVGSVAFAIATLTGRAAAMYLAGVLGLVAYGIAAAAINTPEAGTLSALADPFGMVAFEQVTRFWTVVQRNEGSLAWSGLLGANRTLWLGTSAVVVTATLAWFQRGAGGWPARRARAQFEWRRVGERLGPLNPLPPVPAAAASLTQVRVLWRSDLGRLARSPVLAVVAFFALYNLANNLWNNTSSVAGGMLPTSAWLAGEVGQGLSLFVRGLAVFVAGVVAWRDRDARIDSLTAAAPVGNATVVAGQVAVVLSVVAVLSLAGLAVGEGVQALRLGRLGDPSPWLERYLLLSVVDWIWIAGMAVALQAAAPSRVAGYALSAGVLVASEVASGWGIGPRWRFGALPPAGYSEAEGLGPFFAPVVAHQAYWGAVTIGLLAAGTALRRRSPWSRIGRRYRDREVARPALLAGAAFASAAAIAAGIHEVERAGGAVASDAEARAVAGGYERRFAVFRDDPIDADSVAVVADLSQPGRTRLSGVIAVRNRGDTGVRRVLVTLLPYRVRTRGTLSLDGAESATVDSATGSRVFSLARPLPAGATTHLRFDLEYARRPFRGWGAETENGEHAAFISSERAGWYFPVVGFAPTAVLTDAAERAAEGLPPAARPDPSAPAARRRGLLGERVGFSATVVAGRGYHAVATGQLDSVGPPDAQGRRAYHFHATALPSRTLGIGVGRWSVADFGIGADSVRVLWLSGPATNRARIAAGVLESLRFGDSTFGERRTRQVVVAQVPDFGLLPVTARALPGLIVWSEEYGFGSAPADTASGEVDEVYSTAAHEAAHQWWGIGVAPAMARGAALVLEVLPQWVRQRVLEQRFGVEAVARFRARELDQYLAARGSLKQGEHPLSLTDDPTIVYPKGSVIMAGLEASLGVSALGEALRGFYERFRRSSDFPVSLDLVEAIRDTARNQEAAAAVAELTEVVVWDNRAGALARRGAMEGFAVEIGRFRSDSLGRLSPAPGAARVEVGDGTRGRFRVVGHVAGSADTVWVPVGAVANWRVDPRTLLVDRNPADNSLTVVGRHP